MSRTISEIQEDLQSAWMESPSMQTLYGFAPGTRFTAFYSKASIESLLVYIVSYCAYALEYLFDKTSAEIEERFLQQTPGTCRWYAQKLKDYLFGDEYTLDDWGRFVIPENKTAADIESAHIIRHAVAVDNNAAGCLVLKIAGEDSNGLRCPLPDEEPFILEYIRRIKYAGIKTRLINQEGDFLSAGIDIWYDPLKTQSFVRSQCEKAVQNYIQNLPFNGEFSIMALTDALQACPDVRVVQCLWCRAAVDGREVEITGIDTPYAGYYRCGDITFNMKEYGQTESIQY